MKYEMHSKIKKFWESAGYEIINHTFSATMPELDLMMTNELWYAHKDGDSMLVADISKNKQYYHLDNKHFISEKEMLRLIKLKALL